MVQDLDERNTVYKYMKIKLIFTGGSCSSCSHSSLLALPNILHLALHSLEHALEFLLDRLLVLLRPVATLLSGMHISHERRHGEGGLLSRALRALVVIRQVFKSVDQCANGSLGGRLSEIGVDVGGC